MATDNGEWIIKGFIDVYRRIYTISVDTKIVSKVLEILLLPSFAEFAARHEMKLESPPPQNFYPDLSFTHLPIVKLSNGGETYVHSSIRSAGATA